MPEMTLVTNGHGHDTALAVMPVMDLATAGERYNAMVAFVKSLMHEGADYGVIPGTNGKPVLLKPGAEKLCTFFGLSKRFVLAQSIEDWGGAEHGGEPMFYYLYRCQLWRGDLLVAESDGSCNSRESKYRWRKAERVCPGCGQPTIIKGKAEYGGGWLCFAKRGGCGAKFPTGNDEIESQATGRVPNPDVADAVNTIQKMAQKRALIAATLLAVNASEFFTQDMEDFVDGEVIEAAARAPQTESARPPTRERRASKPKPEQAAVAPRPDGHQPEPSPSDPKWWEDEYRECVTAAAVEDVDRRCPTRYRRHPMVEAARESTMAQMVEDFAVAEGGPVPELTDADWASFIETVVADLASASGDDLEDLKAMVARIPEHLRGPAQEAWETRRDELAAEDVAQ